jgi:hypothetical protein
MRSMVSRRLAASVPSSSRATSRRMPATVWASAARSRPPAPAASLALSCWISRSRQLAALEGLADLGLDVAAAGAEQAGEPVEGLLGLGHARERGLAGDGFDAPDAGGDAGLADDLAQADVAGALHVGAAAEFGGEVADAEHAHVVAVFLAEQGHGAGGHGFVVCSSRGYALRRCADLGVDQRFDGGELVRRSPPRSGRSRSAACRARPASPSA